MGDHSRARSASPLTTRAAAATGLAALGLLAGAGAAFAGDAPSTGGSHEPDGSQCSVGGIAAGGSGTGSPDGVITNGECTDEQNEQAAKDAEAVRDGTKDPDPDYDVDRGLEDQHDARSSGCDDTDTADTGTGSGSSTEAVLAGVI